MATGEEKGSSGISDAPKRVREGERGGGEGHRQDRETCSALHHLPVSAIPGLLASASEVLPLSFLY